MTMKQEDIYQIVTAYFKEQFEIPEEKIKPEANLFEDLGLDSIDALDMIGMLESNLDIEINEEELKKVRTIQDIVNYIVSKIKVPE
jgi:acyl carrier protein